MKRLFVLSALVLTSACGMFGGDDSDNGSSSGGYPDPARVCVQITAENKEQITSEFGHSCKVGDWLSKGAPTCSSSQEKCMSKKY